MIHKIGIIQYDSYYTSHFIQAFFRHVNSDRSRPESKNQFIPEGQSAP